MNTYLKNKIQRIGQMSYILLIFCTASVMAQSGQHTVTGSVTSSEDGLPLPGVSVVLKGTTQGVSSDFDGNYSINATDGNEVLVFSYIGFESQEVAINGRTSIDLSMSPGAQALDEVVVTALGIKREDKSLGYSVENVAGEELTRVAQEHVLNSLSGRLRKRYFRFGPQ